MRRRRVEVVVALLHVLAVIPFGSGQPEEPLLQDRIPAVPQGEPETEPALPVGDAEQTVLAPPVGAAAGVIVREKVPGFAVLGVVLAHRAPLPLGQIGAPALPVPFSTCILREPLELRIACRRFHGRASDRWSTRW